ncbi:hypothetical protein PWT90_03119 [Aphanocladium album]|nr:hypothetical protein PWT90_03119 [Aphanocladium album]
MSPEKLRSFFPERPIRPLPKRRLREKLSPEAIRTIQYPPSAVNSVPLFSPPANAPRGPSQNSSTGIKEELHKAGLGDPDNLESRSVDSVNSNGSSTSLSSAERQLHLTSQENIRYNTALDRGASLDHNISAASSIDGYDSLENTNNKKKRKIPSASDAILRGSPFNSSGSVEILEPAGGMDHGGQVTSSAHAIPPGDSISGPGRGRLSRAVHPRSPLKTLPDGNNTWPSHGAGGIISNAIANAGHLTLSGQENAGGSLLYQPDTEKAAPKAAQFTFTCGSQVAGSASWPDASPSLSAAAEYSRLEQAVREKDMPTDAAVHGKTTSEGGVKSRKNSRRQLERNLRLAARDRRQAAVAAYYDNPPRPQDIWICEFCEYEGIFGSPPKALIREYEMKDRRLRQEEADRRRLLEKAKAKSRKARKGSKSAKATQSANQSPSQVSEDQAIAVAPPMEPSHSQSTQSEEIYTDRIDDYRSRDPPDILGLYGKTTDSLDSPVAKGS